MNNIIFIICITLLIIFNIFSSDNRLHLVHADKTSGKMIENERIHIWKGSVHVYQDTVTMFCDSAIFYEAKNKIDFLGNVLIDDNHHKLFANTIYYDTENKIATCIGNVRISGKTDSLFADKFVYRFKDKSAFAKGNMFLWDKEDGAKLWGDQGYYTNENKESHISGNARLIKPNDKNDTLLITSKKMDYFGIIPKKAIAKDSVRIFQGNLKAKCDSALYNISDEMVFLRINPFAWQNENKMSGLEIDLKLDSLELNEIYITGDGIVETLADSISDQYDLIEGKSIHVTMKNDKPVKLIARDNASSIYLVKEEEEKKGTNAASSDSITIFFNEGVLDSINISGGSEGIFYPADYKGEIKSEH